MQKQLPFNTRLFLTTLMFVVFIASCRFSTAEKESDVNESKSQADFVTPVETLIIQPSVFELELISNGRLYAPNKSRLSFPLSEELKKIHVTNGQQVKKGEILAELCNENLQLKLEKAELQFARASLDMEDILLGRGFTLKDSLDIPPSVWQMAGVRSGYSQALLEIKQIRSDLSETIIRAPFPGVIADLEVHVYEKVSAGEDFCTLIDNTSFLVRFPVMENELEWVREQARVQIVPFAFPDRTWLGQIQSINPMVDENGQVEVTALVSETPGLVEGMNVKVLQKSPVNNQLVVPKQSVLYRDNLEVLFKYVDGEAEWTYVNVLHENSTHYSVQANPNRVASLQAGDTVIVSGNTNLAHGSLVTISTE